MSSDATIIRGRASIHTPIVGYDRSLVIRDDEGNRLVHDIRRNTVSTYNARGEQTASISMSSLERLKLPMGNISPEFRRTLARYHLTDDDIPGAHPTTFLGHAAEAVRTGLLGLGRDLEMRQGDIASFATVLREEQARREQQQAPAPVTVPENRAQAPGASVQQLADKFRQDAGQAKPAPLADGGPKAPAVTESAEEFINRQRAQHGEPPLGQMTGDAEMLAKVEAQVERSMARWRAQQDQQPANDTQPDHGLGGTSGKRQASPETFRA